MLIVFCVSLITFANWAASPRYSLSRAAGAINRRRWRVLLAPGAQGQGEGFQPRPGFVGVAVTVAALSTWPLSPAIVHDTVVVEL
jgi:hypothetical protein